MPPIPTKWIGPSSRGNFMDSSLAFAPHPLGWRRTPTSSRRGAEDRGLPQGPSKACFVT
jgi:hypothetical protein